MSTLIVEICKIEQITEHIYADKLEICKLENLDWFCIVPKNEFKIGQLVLYIPIDSILPEKIESKIFGSDSKIKLEKRRVRSIKIRK
ncbi:MAG: RNA ligase, partial [Patescibacteria group bacterium]